MTALLPFVGSKPLQASPDERVLAAVRENAVFSFSISGGKDGLCAAHAAMRLLDELGHPRSLRHAIHADLGRSEWRETPATVERQTEFLGLPLVVVRRKQGDMLSMWRQRYDDGIPMYTDLRHIRLRGPWSSASQKFCQAGQKRDQFVKAHRANHPRTKVVSVIGVRRDESAARSKRPISSWEAKMTLGGVEYGLNWNAIVEWTTQDVFDYARLHGLPMHDAYSVWGSTRLSCAFCVMSSRADVQASLSNPLNRPLHLELVRMEAATGFSFQQQSWLADARPELLDPETRAAISCAKEYSAERRFLEALVPDDFLKPPKGDTWPARRITRPEAQAVANARRLVSSWLRTDLPYLDVDSVEARIAEMIERKNEMTEPNPKI